LLIAALGYDGTAHFHLRQPHSIKAWDQAIGPTHDAAAERHGRVVGTVRERTALHDLADRSGGRLEVGTSDVVTPETNAFSQTADAQPRSASRPDHVRP